METWGFQSLTGWRTKGQRLSVSQFRDRAFQWIQALKAGSKVPTKHAYMKVKYTMNSFSPEEVLNKGKKPSGPAALKAPAVQVRRMVPLLPILANKHLDHMVPHQPACQRLADLWQWHDAMERCDTKMFCQELARRWPCIFFQPEKEALKK